MSYARFSDDSDMPRTRPVLFSGPLVRAILDGRKTVTRRLVKPAPPSIEAVRTKSGSDFSIFTNGATSQGMFRVAGPVWAVRELLGAEPEWRCPYGVPGDRLWVRETWTAVDKQGWAAATWQVQEGDNLIYRADNPALEAPNRSGPPKSNGRWLPSIHMLRWASRITLEVTSIRVERLQDITEEDARGEGVDTSLPGRINGEPVTIHTFGPDAHCKAFALLWDAINGKRASWKSNPWVWRIEFRRIDP